MYASKFKEIPILIFVIVFIFEKFLILIYLELGTERYGTFMIERGQDTCGIESLGHDFLVFGENEKGNKNNLAPPKMTAKVPSVGATTTFSTARSTKSLF